MTTRRKRDVTRPLTAEAFAAKLRKIAAAVLAGRGFVVQVQGERLFVPAGAAPSIEHEREGAVQELELQLRWTATRRARGGRS
jgi:hypothetical protein